MPSTPISCAGEVGGQEKTSCFEMFSIFRHYYTITLFKRFYEIDSYYKSNRLII